MVTPVSPPLTTAQPLRRQPWRSRSLFNAVMTVGAGMCLLVTLIPLGLVLGFVLFKGFQRLDWALLTALPPPPGLAEGGVGNAILGTVIVVAIATALAVPLGVMSAVYLSEFSQDGIVARWVRFFTNVLSGVPSIISGVFVYGLLVQTGITGYSAIAGGVALGILMLPTVVRTTDEALQLAPQSLRWGAIALGASRSQTVLQIVLPTAVSAILTGVLLGIARAAGETAPLIFTALFSPFWPSGLFNPIASLAVLIYNFARAPFVPQQELAWAASLILVGLVLLTSVLSRWATQRRP